MCLLPSQPEEVLTLRMTSSKPVSTEYTVVDGRYLPHTSSFMRSTCMPCTARST